MGKPRHWASAQRQATSSGENIRCSINNTGADPNGGKGIVEWVLRSREGSELTGFEDHAWNGVTTNQFAELCRRIIEARSFDPIRRESGACIIAAPTNAATTKYDLLCCIREVTGRNVVVHAGRSSTASARILGSVYSSLRDIYPERHSWDALIRDAVAGPSENANNGG